MTNYSNDILSILRCDDLSLAALCDRMGIRPMRNGRWSRAASSKYNQVSTELQRLKRAGKVRLVRGQGRGAGGEWCLVGSRRVRRTS